MDNFSKENYQQSILTKKFSDKSFTSAIRRDFIGKELQAELNSANVLIVPNEGFEEELDLIYFPSGTSDLYQYLLGKRNEKFFVNVCIEEDDYKEISIRADWMIIADFIVRDLVQEQTRLQED